MSSNREMPRYKSIKEVWALKIEKVEYAEGGAGSAFLSFVEAGYDTLEMSNSWAIKHAPRAGGYFVQYSNGYQSYSPAEAFEEGHERIN